MSMVGKICVVTGGTAGIGREMAVGLARKGARLAIVGRDAQKAGVTVRRVEEVGGEADVYLADLAEMGQVRDLAAQLLDRYERVDVLANNAGVATQQASATSDGFDVMMATNHLGPFLLTNLLLDRLVQSGPSRIVNTASESHRHAGQIKLEKAGPDRRRGTVGLFADYGATKLLNVLLTRELAERLRATQVTANCFCPGRVASDLSREDPLFARVERAMAKVKLTYLPEQGARLGITLASDPALAEVSGRFFTTTPGMRFLPPTPRSRNAALRREAWEKSAQLVGLG